MRVAVVFAFAICGLAGACSTSEASDESGSADDCQAAWTITQQLQMQRQLADDDFSEIDTMLDATLDEIDTSAVSTALGEMNDGIVAFSEPTPNGYVAWLHIDRALASLGLACVESSPDLYFR